MESGLRVLLLLLLLLRLRLRLRRRGRGLSRWRRSRRETDGRIGGGSVTARGRRDLDKLGRRRQRRRKRRIDLMILRVNLMMRSFVIVMNDGRILHDRREGGGRIRESELVVIGERNLLLMRDGGHVLRVWP